MCCASCATHAIGSYGGTALVLLVALKVAAYGALLSGQRWWAAILFTPAVGRWSILLLTAALPYARQTPSVVRDMGKGALIWGTLTLAICSRGIAAYGALARLLGRR